MSPGPTVPEPPIGRTPREESWPSGLRLWHVYRRRAGTSATSFFSGPTPQRFRPILNRAGTVVPTLYGADAEVGAYFETLFRAWNEALSAGRCASIGKNDIAGRSLAELALRRPLRLAQLYGQGLSRLQTPRAELIEPSGPAEYAQTAKWGQWLWGRAERFDGIAWVSRRNDAVRSCMLFGDRVGESELEIVDDRPLDDAAGFVRVQAVAADCGILVACTYADLLTGRTA